MSIGIFSIAASVNLTFHFLELAITNAYDLKNMPSQNLIILVDLWILHDGLFCQSVAVVDGMLIRC